MHDEDMAALYFLGRAPGVSLETLEQRLLSLQQVVNVKVTNEVPDEVVIGVHGTEDLDPHELGDMIEEFVQELQAEAQKPKPTIVLSTPGAGKSWAMRAALAATIAGRYDMIICDDLAADFKLSQFDLPKFEIPEEAYENPEVVKAHLNFEEKQKLKTKGCRSKQRRKW